MNIGMLWFDNDTKKPLAQRVQRAADYYQKKYGRHATVCFLHPAMIPQNAPELKSIKLCQNQSILPNHFWLGVEEQEEAIGGI